MNKLFILSPSTYNVLGDFMFKSISVVDLKNCSDGTIIDIRNNNKYIDGHILNAKNVLYDQLLLYPDKFFDKKKIKNIILYKPKIQYSFDKISNKIDDLKLKIDESDNRLNKVFKKENERAYVLYDQLLLYPDKFLNKFTKYYIYCQKGFKSKGLCAILCSKGYNVININGGYEAWILDN